MKTFGITIGNDPELFVKKGMHLIPGESLAMNKTFPRYVKVDNAALEIHPGPYACLQQQNASLAKQITGVRKILGEDYQISLRTCERVRPMDLKRFKSLTAFGCEPSLIFHPEHGVMTSTPEADPMKVRERSIGFHVHLGSRTPTAIAREMHRTEEAYQKMGYINHNWKQRYEVENTVANLLHTTEGRARLVQACDLLAGLPAVLIDRDSRQIWRRKLLGYGKAGEFREQKHGFEYRTLGPWPLIHPMLAWWANAAVRDAFLLVLNDVDLEIKKKINMLDVATAINTNSLAKAIPIWNILKELVPRAIPYTVESHPWAPNNIRKFEFLVVEGGLKLLANKGLQSSTWLQKRENETDNRAWGAYYQGFPNGMDEIFNRPDQKVYREYQDFIKNWSLDTDVLTKYLL